jgi:hypothetical protein
MFRGLGGRIDWNAAVLVVEIVRMMEEGWWVWDGLLWKE